MEAPPSQSFGVAEGSKYKKLEEIGDGTYGVVFKGYDEETKEIVAIKKIKFDVDTEGIPPTALREISILREVESPNVIKLKDIVYASQRLYLIFEFAEYDLKTYIRSVFKDEPLPPNQIKKIVF